MLAHSFVAAVGYENSTPTGGLARFALGKLKRTEESAEEAAVLMQITDHEGTEVVNYCMTTDTYWIVLDLMMSCFQHVNPPSPEDNKRFLEEGAALTDGRLRINDTPASIDEVIALGRKMDEEDGGYPPLMFPLDSDVYYVDDYGRNYSCKVLEHVEGWYKLEFIDKSDAIVRPSRVKRK